MYQQQKRWGDAGTNREGIKETYTYTQTKINQGATLACYMAITHTAGVNSVMMRTQTYSCCSWAASLGETAQIAGSADSLLAPGAGSASDLLDRAVQGLHRLFL